jgi:hypothetical protein
MPGDPHLRSARDTTGHTIRARDGDIGHLADYLVGDDVRQLEYLIVATRDWWPGKKVLISPDWVEWVSWVEQAIHVDVTRDAVRRAPEYDFSTIVDPDLERRLHAAHGREPMLTEDEHAAQRSGIGADRVGIPRAPETPPLESPDSIRHEVWRDDRSRSRD